MKNGLKAIWHSYQSGLKVILLSVVESTVSVSKSIRPESVSTISVSPVVPRIGSSLGLSLSLTLAVVAKTVSTVVSSKTVSVSQSVSSVAVKVRISSSLGLGLGLMLAVVAKTISTVVSSETVSVSQSVSSVAVEVRISGSLCFGFRLSGSDGRKSENYELKRRELKERKKVVGCFFTKEVVAGALTNFMLSAE